MSMTSETPNDGIANLAVGRPMTGAWPGMAWFLFALPHFAIPAGPTYRPPAASLILILLAMFSLLQPSKIRLSADHSWLRTLLIAFFIYCVMSTFYGLWVLGNANKLVLALTTGNVEYFRIAAERLLQILLVIAALEAVRQSRFTFNQLMKWWLTGTVSAAVLHLLTYVITDDTLMQRAGTFNEGNLAGMYYLLSVFLALEFRRNNPNRSGTLYLIAPVVGILLSRSSAGIMLLALILAVRYVFAGKNAWRQTFRSVLVLIVMPLAAMALYVSGLDLGIGEKLFEEELTPKSFSRIDRLESMYVAFLLFLESPIIGNGLQTYGFLSNDLISGPLQLMYDSSYRRIPNNIYLELAAELGGIGLVLFGAIISSLLKRCLRLRAKIHSNLLFGLLTVLLYWVAFPTYSVVFIWVFFAFILVAERHYYCTGKY